MACFINTLTAVFVGVVLLSGSSALLECDGLTLTRQILGKDAEVMLQAIEHFENHDCTEEAMRDYVVQVERNLSVSNSQGGVQPPVIAPPVPNITLETFLQPTTTTVTSTQTSTSTVSSTESTTATSTSPEPTTTAQTTTTAAQLTNITLETFLQPTTTTVTSTQTSTTAASSTVGSTTATSTSPQPTTTAQTTTTAAQLTTDDLEKWVTHGAVSVDHDAEAQCRRQVENGFQADDCDRLKRSSFNGVSHQIIHNYVFNEKMLDDDQYIYILLDRHEIPVYGLYLERAELPNDFKVQRRPIWAVDMDVKPTDYPREVRSKFVNSYY